ncbi:MAG: carbohydrate ABC transporter permease [Eubacteriales bacterium]|nr:carbohydrate ABC transporter permease [Eubacteriales bacterium]
MSTQRMTVFKPHTSSYRFLMLGGYVVALALSVMRVAYVSWTPSQRGTLQMGMNLLWIAFWLEETVRLIRMNRAQQKRFLLFHKCEGLFLLASIPCMVLDFPWVLLLKMPYCFSLFDDEKVFQKLANGVVIVLILLFVLPFLHVIAVAFSGPSAIVNIWPVDFDLFSLTYVLGDSAFFRAILNSVLITAIGTLISVFAMTMAAYPLSKKEMPFRRTMMVFFLIVMLFNGGMAPNILLMNSLGLNDTLWSLIFPSVVMVFHLLLIKGFFEDVPAELEESAKLDGAGNYTILFRIIVPVAAPMIATVIFFTAISFWNNINNSILYITSNQAIYPLPMYIKNFLSMNPVDIASNNPTLLSYWNNVKMSYILISILPVLLCYPIIFRYLKNGVAMGAVKG